MNEIENIIAKVRSMYKYDPKYRDVLREKASVELEEDDKGLNLTRIHFHGREGWDDIYVTDKNIKYYPYEARERDVVTLAEYDGFDALLEM